ncbi:hypothetical protein PoB_000455500 [Plakobranchus ocellatus]|uniref:Uncharacterized protein n=1 Tax=Plakobranchus ocellatus TaxID=259542 RepID=A0AAV3Y4L6_9GAST|nr:hypothetical protein PoB_000455500 [Plakobranchus ocellatus]
MAVEGTGVSENVFIQSPRVSFGEPPVSLAPSSLLTFADMVLSLDHNIALENIKSTKASKLNVGLGLDELALDLDLSKAADHTYASSRSVRATRSQTARAAQLSTVTSTENQRVESDADIDLEIDLDSISDEDPTLEYDNENDILELEGSLRSTNSPRSRSRLQQPSQSPSSAEIDLGPFNVHDYCAKSKRCSSEENIAVETPQSKRYGSNKEWPESHTKLEKHSQKSCSFDEMDKKYHIKQCKSSESFQRGSVSQTLHRFVNNTLEFPCWPRKADHTYATATWDGTAASHNLFDKDRDSHSERFITRTDDQPMDGVELEAEPSGNIQLQSKHVASAQYSHCNLQQKEDHTYVKHTCNPGHLQSFVKGSLANCEGGDKPVISKEGLYSMDHATSKSENRSTWPHKFSSATFPRLKSREDHTYFHSGLSGSSGGSAGREWVSAQTVATVELSQDMQIEETYRSLHSFSHSASAKKDHNYSTSA